MRSSIGDLYAWRAKQATDPAEKQRMNAAADLAFRQAWALCPWSSEAVFRYVDFLANERRFSAAGFVAETAAKMPELNGPDRANLQSMGQTLRTMQ